jgi:hypothetical protein
MNMLLLVNTYLLQTPARVSKVLNPSTSKIVTQALLALREETGLDLALSNQLPIDSEADCFVLTPAQTLAVEVKRNIRPEHLGAIIHHIKNLHPIGLLIADYINPNIAKTLKENDVQYLDACGNSYLNLPPIFVNITGQKSVLDTKKETNKAFDTSGLKLIYGFLCDKNLVGASYREIAEQTGIALGAVGTVLNGLVDAGYLINQGKAGKRQLINRRKLLDRWVEAYSEKLKPKLHVGEFISDDPSWWKTFDIAKFGAYWGGEIGAAKYTDYLRPKIATVYLPEASGNKLLAAAKLKKSVEWSGHDPSVVNIYRPFWTDKLQSASALLIRDTVHPILIYADLIATAGSRNLETARMLYDHTIIEYIGED